ncbi:MAG: type II toxin-antitoxin system Phd/YefM family antitoxin [Chloroflexi bacterium]|nr:type II toxin-antitoxin system Phd/YefM family antitoxin [Chloroflexota bacterium]
MNSLITDTIVSFTDFRENLTAYINRVRRGQPVSVTEGKKADIIIIKRDEIARLLRRIEELEALVETYEILSDSKAMDEIRQSEEDITAGRFVTLDELEAEWSRS